jgi:hypothetical protein
MAYLHWASIDEETIQIFSSLGGSIALAEGQGSDTAASAVLIVGDHDPLDWAS